VRAILIPQSKQQNTGEINPDGFLLKLWPNHARRRAFLLIMRTGSVRSYRHYGCYGSRCYGAEMPHLQFDGH
jgi:hypothetical protein